MAELSVGEFSLPCVSSPGALLGCCFGADHGDLVLGRAEPSQS